jgi:hypothetical protein
MGTPGGTEESQAWNARVHVCVGCMGRVSEETHVQNGGIATGISARHTHARTHGHQHTRDGMTDALTDEVVC